MPRGDLTAGLLERPLADRHDEAGLLGQVDELVRADEPALRVLPAQECLEAGDPPLLQLDDRLVVQAQLAALERAVQVVAGAQVADGAVVRLDRVELGASAPGLLGAVHGGVGVAEQRLGRLELAARERDADAARSRTPRPR